jgi:hypothetical protein
MQRRRRQDIFHTALVADTPEGRYVIEMTPIPPSGVGISDATAGSTAIGMNLVIIPPGATAEAHYHDGFETAI